MRIGLENAGWQIAFANDIDGDKWDMYRGHIGDTGEFIVRDIHKLEISEVPAVALATASFPCNDLSLAGARHGPPGQTILGGDHELSAVAAGPCARIGSPVAASRSFRPVFHRLPH